MKGKGRYTLIYFSLTCFSFLVVSFEKSLEAADIRFRLQNSQDFNLYHALHHRVLISLLDGKNTGSNQNTILLWYEIWFCIFRKYTAPILYTFWLVDKSMVSKRLVLHSSW